jgi:type IV pilus assembly protein PilX
MNSSRLLMLKPTALQSGFSLITTLILLIVVTVLGLAASRIVLMSEKTSRFDRDTQIAFQAAEAALIDAELDIQGPNTDAAQRMNLFELKNKVNFVAGCGTGSQQGMCTPADAGAKPIWYQVDFTDEAANAKTVKLGQFTGRAFAVGSTGIRPEIAPRYIVEVIPDPTPSATLNDVLYRITAMGFGPRKETQVVLQIVFRKV